METSGKLLMVCGGLLAVVVAGLVSVILARQPATTTVLYSPQASAASLTAQDMAPVLIAARLIPRGFTVHASDVPVLFKQVYEPKAAVPAEAVFADPAQLTSLLSVVPRRTTDTIQPGAQITAPLLSGMALPHQIDSLSNRIPKGYDGETVSVEAPVKSVDGAIAVNDRVDVIYSKPSQQGSDTKNRYSALLIQNATVVATGPISNTYTLALRPSDALRLAYVQDEGWSLHLVLRSVYDGSSEWNARAMGAASLGG